MEPSLETASLMHRIFQATDEVLQTFPSDLQPFLTEVIWSGGDVDGVAQEMNFQISYAHGAWRAFRSLLLEHSPELKELENNDAKHN
jgi:hypothetical protein